MEGVHQKLLLDDDFIEDLFQEWSFPSLIKFDSAVVSETITTPLRSKVSDVVQIIGEVV